MNDEKKGKESIQVNVEGECPFDRFTRGTIAKVSIGNGPENCGHQQSEGDAIDENDPKQKFEKGQKGEAKNPGQSGRTDHKPDAEQDKKARIIATVLIFGLLSVVHVSIDFARGDEQINHLPGSEFKVHVIEFEQTTQVSNQFGQSWTFQSTCSTSIAGDRFGQRRTASGSKATTVGHCVQVLS